MAHGELMMVGAYATYVVQVYFANFYPTPLIGIYSQHCPWHS
jgi:branched-subunit amino acid ABC-type transport system permease component